MTNDTKRSSQNLNAKARNGMQLNMTIQVQVNSDISGACTSDLNKKCNPSPGTVRNSMNHK